MIASSSQIQCVTNFQDLVSTPYQDDVNAICWTRNLIGDFGEIVEKVALEGNMLELDEAQLRALQLSEQGQLAREILLEDLTLLKAQGASPVLNIIKYYERDDAFPFFPTDVYSFHVDRSPIPTHTFLCTYYGESSDILPNAQATQKIRIPAIRAELIKSFELTEEDVDAFASENFFDLHYQAKPNAQPINLGIGHVWRLAVDHPESKVPPCVHRAPKEKNGQHRLLMIC